MKKILTGLLCICVILLCACTAEKQNAEEKVKFTDQTDPVVTVETDTDDPEALQKFNAVFEALSALRAAEGKTDITEGFDSIPEYLLQNGSRTISWMDFSTPHQNSTITEKAVYVEINDGGKLKCLIIASDLKEIQDLSALKEYFEDLRRKSL